MTTEFFLTTIGSMWAAIWAIRSGFQKLAVGQERIEGAIRTHVAEDQTFQLELRQTAEDTRVRIARIEKLLYIEQSTPSMTLGDKEQ